MAVRAAQVAAKQILVHTMRLADGPLSEDKGASLLKAVRNMSHRIVTLDA